MVAACLAALTACSSGGGEPKEPGLLRADAARPTVGPADLTAAAKCANAFGVDVFHAVADGKDGDILISPTSLATVLTMVMPGARGRTATEMAATLHATLPAGQFADALGALNQATVQRALDDKADLQQYDSAWTQKGYDLQQSYLKALASAFDTGMHETDFAGAPESARETINKTVQDQTDGLIKDLFPAGTITGDTRLALTDALYFKAKWAEEFPKSATSDVPFHRLDGSAPPVSTMSLDHRFAYSEGEGWQYLDLPYDKDHLAMGVVLPAAGTFDAFRKGLTADQLAAMAGAASDTDVDLQLPKFTFDTSLSLKEALTSLGMASLFDPDTADLSGIPAKPEKLSVGTVVQKTHVAVDEQGTTAAAASGVGVVAGAAPGQVGKTVTMHVDRPFLVLIRDTVSGQILFLGQVTDPRR